MVPVHENNAKWVTRCFPIQDPVLHFFFFQLKCSQKAIPYDEDTAKILVDVGLVRAVVNPVMRWRIENVFKPAQFSDHFSMDEELGNIDERLDGNDHGRRKTEQAQGCPEKETEAGIEHGRANGRG